MVAMIHIDAFLPLIMPYVGTCPQMVATSQLRQAAIEFCERTRLWKEDITWTIAANDETIPVPPYASLHVIKQVRHEGNKLEAAVEFDLDDLVDAGTPQFYAEPYPNTLHIRPFVEGEVKIKAILKPSQGQAFGTGDTPQTDQDAFDQLPAFMHKDHGATLADGAIAKISLMPNQEFTNPELAQYHLSLFTRSVDSLSQSELRHQVRPRLRTETRWY